MDAGSARFRGLNKRSKVLIAVAGIVVVAAVATVLLLANEDLRAAVGLMSGTVLTGRDVDTQFAAFPEKGGHTLAFAYAKVNGEYVGDDPRECKHYQGIQRVRNANGTNFFILTRSGNHTGSCSTAGDDPGELLVVRMDSMGTTSGVLNTNRGSDGKGDPDADDDTVQSYHFDGSTVTNSACGNLGTWPGFMHPGGMQLIENVLVVPLERTYPGDEEEGAVVLFDVTRPACPTLIKTIRRADVTNAPSSFPGDSLPMIGVVGVYKATKDGRYIFLLTGGGGPFNHGRTVMFFETTTTTLNPANPADLKLKYLDTWTSSELADEGKWCNDCYWFSGTGLRANTLEWQNLNFVRDRSNNWMYLIGTGNTTSGTSEGADWARLFQVTRDTSTDTFAITYVDEKHLYLNTPDNMGDLDAGAGVYVNASGKVILYTADHDNEGPSVNGRDTLEMGEFAAP